MSEDKDIDIMRDVYMTNTQREAYNRIVEGPKDITVFAGKLGFRARAVHPGEYRTSAMLYLPGTDPAIKTLRDALVGITGTDSVPHLEAAARELMKMDPINNDNVARSLLAVMALLEVRP